ncbi:hypothetical protein C8F04DRAFT_1163362 [Mycena alexandri]|uniref:Secreted protein n=1 Tax=Mycena alexandri TaxID=1745969 RepID=A0AAD6RVY1_9AGAR|nr:hypothetical protein C8F04DRAFT_1163362 [Mycena alexandri]
MPRPMFILMFVFISRRLRSASDPMPSDELSNFSASSGRIAYPGVIEPPYIEEGVVASYGYAASGVGGYPSEYGDTGEPASGCSRCVSICGR